MSGAAHSCDCVSGKSKSIMEDMIRRTDGRTDGRIDERTDGRRDRETDTEMITFMSVAVHGYDCVFGKSESIMGGMIRTEAEMEIDGLSDGRTIKWGRTCMDKLSDK